MSSSMQRNWKNSDGKKLPKIQIIRDALNKQIQKVASSPLRKKRQIDIFCLGMGFKRPMYFSKIEIKHGYENELNTELEKRTNVGVVCDILALSETIPSQKELQKLDQAINKRWNGYAERLIDQKVKIPPSIYEHLRSYIYSALNETATQRLQKTLTYRIYLNFKDSQFIHEHNITKWLFDKLSHYVVDIWEKSIERKSSGESKRYLDAILDGVKKTFDECEEEYVNFIKDTLNQFVSTQTRTLVDLVTLGYSANRILEYFDEKTVEDLAAQIYKRLKKDVEKSMRTAWLSNRQTLWWTTLDLRASVDSKHVREVTEQCVNKFSWDRLRPFVEYTVKDLFATSLQAHAKEKMPDWIGLASHREVVRPLKQVINLLPDSFDENVYSDEFMFGSTPFTETMARVSIRFLDKGYKRYEKVLVIISDGEFDSNFPKVTAQLLKQEGVSIVGCYVSEQDVLSKLASQWQYTWPEGAKNLFEISSLADEQNTLAKLGLQEEVRFPKSAKLFYQINQSELLEDLMEAILTG